MFPRLLMVCLAGACSWARADFLAYGIFNPARGVPSHVGVLGLPNGLTLSSPLIFEDFERVSEFDLTALGWTEQNYTDTVTTGMNPNNATSDTYLGWVLITRQRLQTVFGSRRLNVAPNQWVNGQPVGMLLSGNLLYAESDQRSGDQVQFLYSPIYDFAGQRNLVLSFHSAYEQNQDSIAGIEYTADRGETWHPVIYMIDRDDIVRVGAQIDAVATLNAQHSDVAVYFDPARGVQVGRSYGAFLAAPISAALAPYISGRVNDDATESKRVEAFRIPLADEQPNVQFRIFQAGTASWYWGIDNWGVYSIPPSREISAQLVDNASGASTAVQATLILANPALTATAVEGTPRLPAAGTDAAASFPGVVAGAAPTLLAAGGSHRVRLEGMDPGKVYELRLYSDLGRGDGSTGVLLSYTLAGAEAFQNLSSIHPTLSSVSGAFNETTTIDISDNSAAGRGLVCVYGGIRCGGDGMVEVMLHGSQAASLNALSLVEVTLEPIRLSALPLVSEDNATLLAQVTSETAVQVYVAWGRTNGGEETDDWDNVQLLGGFTSGLVETTIQDLETFKEYHYAFVAVGPEGATWSAPGAFRPQIDGMIYRTGFEPDERDPFVPGSLQGQGPPGLWRVRLGQATVQPGIVSSGLQAVQAGECTLEVGLTNDTPVLWIDAFFMDAGTTNQPLVPTNIASSVLVFSASQGILALDGDGQGGGTFVPVVADYAKDRFVRATVRADYVAKRYDVWIDGVEQRRNLGFKDNSVQRLSGAQRRAQSSNFMDDFSVSVWGLDADSDGDGLVDLDEAKFYGSYPLLADSDGDGAWDGHEVLAGTDPADERSRFAVTIELDAQGRRRIAIPTISGLEYTLQRRETLQQGQWEDVPGASEVAGDGQNKVFLETSDGMNYFYRGVIQNR